MVPTLTCGLERSNFALPMDLSSISSKRSTLPASTLAGRLGHDLGLDVLGRLLVSGELHAVAGAPLGERPQVGRVAEHLRERYLAGDHLRAAAGFHALHPAAARRDVADDLAHVLRGRRDLDRH